MGSWYWVIKTIKGHRYLYVQRTWREGKHVRTESRYIGPADGGSGNRVLSELEPLAEAARNYSSVEEINDPRPKGQGIVVSIPRVRRKRRGMRPEEIQARACRGYRRLYRAHAGAGEVASSSGGCSQSIGHDSRHPASRGCAARCAHENERGGQNKITLSLLFQPRAVVVTGRDVFESSYNNQALNVLRKSITDITPQEIPAMLAELKKLTKRSQVDMSRRWDEVAFGEQIQMLEEIQQGGHAIADFYTLVTTTDAGPAHPELTLHGRVAYHGSRDGITGPPEPSESGRLRPGFYLTSNEQASRFAIYDPKWAAYPAGGLPEPQYEGTVHAFDLSDLRLKIRIGGSGAIGSGAASPR